MSDVDHHALVHRLAAVLANVEMLTVVRDWLALSVAGDPGGIVLDPGHTYARLALRSRVTLGRRGFFGIASCAKPATGAQ